jgi:uncharacterized phage-associated protein
MFGAPRYSRQGGSVELAAIRKSLGLCGSTSLVKKSPHPGFLEYYADMTNWFNERKAAQVAAFFCEKEGGAISVLKLMKLIYLSDRESMAQCGFPITNDYFVSMPHGPVNSMTLNLINGNSDEKKNGWNELISDRADHMVGLSRARTEADIEELSEFEIEVLETVWTEFGKMGRWEIRDWTHANCPEWEDPSGSCTPIPHERVLKFLKIEGADEIAAEISELRHVESVFNGLRL